MPGRKNLPDSETGIPQEIDEERIRFVAFLRSRGLKLTKQRQVIFEEVFREHDHLEAEEIVDRLKKNGKIASRATVYRTLELLVEADCVKAVRPGTSQMYYEHVHCGEHHDHLVCVECSEIFEFFSPELEDTQTQVCNDLDFTPHKHTMVIYGVCRKCRGRKK